MVRDCNRAGLRVALRKESVDRNWIVWRVSQACVVALRKESVDRNNDGVYKYGAGSVALRKESVDRNPGSIGTDSKLHSRSPQGERG